MKGDKRMSQVLWELSLRPEFKDKIKFKRNIKKDLDNNLYNTTSSK